MINSFDFLFVIVFIRFIRYENISKYFIFLKTKGLFDNYFRESFSIFFLKNEENMFGN